MGRLILDASGKQSSLISLPHFCLPGKTRDLGFQRLILITFCPMHNPVINLPCPGLGLGCKHGNLGSHWGKNVANLM